MQTVFSFNRYILLIAFACFTGTKVHAQLTKIYGKITDAGTGEALSFVNIVFKGTAIGGYSDAKGNYEIQISKPVDSLTFSFVGYAVKTIKIQRGKIQQVNIKLQPANFTFSEVEIKPVENPAHIIMRKVIANKTANNPDEYNTVNYSVYNKLEVDINDYPESLKKSFWLKGADFIFNHTDSTADGRKYVPVFFTECISDVIKVKSTGKKQEIIKASRISGMENESVTQLLGDMYQHINIYNNYIGIFGKQFVSPLNNQFLFFYKYYLTDTINIDDSRCFKLLVVPKRKQDLTFSGTIYIDEKTFAVKKGVVKFNDQANINYVRGFEVEQNYAMVDRRHWFMVSEKAVADVAPLESKDNLGFFLRKTTHYQDININSPVNDSVFDETNQVKVLENSSKKNDDFWLNARPENLSDTEKGIYLMVDSLNKVKRLKRIKHTGEMLLSGYLPWHKARLGPYYTFFSWNPVEGYRLKIGGETSPKLSRNFQLRAAIAYGLNDNRFKFRNQLLVYVNKHKKHNELLTITYNNDVRQICLSPTAAELDNFITSLMVRDTALGVSLTNLEEYRINYDYEWKQGISYRLWFSSRQYQGLGSFVFSKNTTDGIKKISNVGTSEIGLNFRIAPGEKTVDGAFRRKRLRAKAPVTEFDIVYGRSFLSFSRNKLFNYIKTAVRIYDKVNINPIGYGMYQVEAGRIFGNAPYLFMQIHQGSQIFALDRNSFNMMRVFEFCSDKYIHVFYEHHFEGFFLNKLPLFRKLKWREVGSIKSVIGDISNKNLQIMNYALNINPKIGLTPYIEAGAGIENILKVIRLDAIWRVTHRLPGYNNFGIRIAFVFNL